MREERKREGKRESVCERGIERGRKFESVCERGREKKVCESV